MTLEELQEQLDKHTSLEEFRVSEEVFALALEALPPEERALFQCPVNKWVALNKYCPPEGRNPVAAVHMGQLLRVLMGLTAELARTNDALAKAEASLEWIAEEVAIEHYPSYIPPIAVGVGITVGRAEVAAKVREGLTYGHTPPHGPWEVLP